MVSVYRQLPVFVDKHIAWRDETEFDETLLKIVDDFLHLCLIDVDDFLA